MKRWTPWVQSISDAPDSYKVRQGLVYSNNRYTVIAYKHKNPVEGGPDIFHLSIRNNDRSARHDWRDFQRIKNELIGEEYEAVEIYPQEQHLVDGANQYHLWGYLDPNKSFTSIGLGWRDGRVIWDGKGEHPVPGAKNAKQRIIHS